MDNRKKYKLYLDPDVDLNEAARYRLRKSLDKQDECEPERLAVGDNDSRFQQQHIHDQQDEQLIGRNSYVEEILFDMSFELRQMQPENEDTVNNDVFLEESALREVIASDDEFGPANERQFKKPQNLQELMETEGFFNVIASPVRRSPGELLLMALKFSMCNKLSFTGTANLLKLINLIFEDSVLNDSRYFIDKFFNDNDTADFHAVCHNCSAYIGKLGVINTVLNCRMCGTRLDLSKTSCNNCFVIIDPSTALAQKLKAFEDHYDFVLRERPCSTRDISDIYDGKQYRRFVNSLSEEDKRSYATAILNTDGAPVFVSSSYSIWPVFIMLNELPVQDRFNHLITCGLWFGKNKPDMTTFLDPFVDAMNKLSTSGIQCNIKGENRVVKLFTVTSCVDSVARAPMQGIKQFNGRYGCNWCLHPGQYAAGSMRYPILQPSPPLRDTESTIKYMLVAATSSDCTYGIKNPSPLINLLGFDIIKAFVPDVLHISEGIGKQFMTYFINQMSQEDRNNLSESLNKIKAPFQIGRLSRPLSDRNYWKAREWENWILYFSIPLLKGKIETKLLKHWMLFVESLYILLQKKISFAEVNRAQELLYRFVSQTEQYYTISAMTYNVHQLLHLASSAADWGPLWAHSTYSFEAGNHYLLQAIHCAKGVNLQILRYLNLNYSLLHLQTSVYHETSANVIKYCSDLHSTRVKKSVTKSVGITYFGKGRTIDNTLATRLQLPIETFMVYSRMVKDGCAFASHLRPNKRSNNCYAQLLDKTIIKINTFVVDEENNVELTVYNIVRTCNSFTDHYKPLQKIVSVTSDELKVPTKSIDVICVHVQVDNEHYLCPVPNLYHY